MLSWKELARLFAESETKAELEFAIVELLKKDVDENDFWLLVNKIREKENEKVY